MRSHELESIVVAYSYRAPRGPTGARTRMTATWHGLDAHSRERALALGVTRSETEKMPPSPSSARRRSVASHAADAAHADSSAAALSV